MNTEKIRVGGRGGAARPASVGLMIEEALWAPGKPAPPPDYENERRAKQKHVAKRRAQRKAKKR